MGKRITDQECCCLPDILCNLCLDDNAMEWARVTFEGIVHRAGEDPCGSSDVPPCPGGDCSLLNGTYLLHGRGGTSDCCRWGFQPENNDDVYPPCHCGDLFELKLCCSEEDTLEWELWIDITTSGYVVAYIDWDQEEACEVIGDPPQASSCSRVRLAF